MSAKDMCDYIGHPMSWIVWFDDHEKDGMISREDFLALREELANRFPKNSKDRDFPKQE